MRFLLIIIGVFFYLNIYGQATKRGGFIYNWSNYTSDNYTGLGSRAVLWDSTGLVDIVHAPPIGIHPRIYFGPSEIPAIKNRLDSTVSGQAVKATIHAYTTLLHLQGGYNQGQPYALDPDGNRHINNSGAWSMGSYYTKLKNQDLNVWNGATIKHRHRTAALMSLEAFMCLLYNGQTDPDVGISYQARAQDLANAMHFWATLALSDPNLGPNTFNLLGGTHMALCYDLNYNNLSQNQRDTVRLALSKIIPTLPRYGYNLACYANTSNWSTLNSFEIITNLAIEGEPGYQAQLTREWMRSVYNFINYGWYPSGAGYEGLGKNYMFITTLIAAAKRGYSLLSHSHLRAYGEQFLPAITQPFGKGFTSYDVWGGSGYDPVLGQYKFNSADAVGLKWVFPNSNKIDFVWRNYISTFYQNNSEGYVYAQVYPDDSYNNYLIPAAVFAQDYSTDSWQNQANQTMPTEYVAMDRGLGTFRSGTDKNDMAMQFHARQDMGGHTHGDRLDFTMSGLSRIWIRKTYGGSPFQPSDFHSMVLVDGLGVGVGDPDGDKCRQPSTVLGYRVNTDISSIAADATYAYTWEWHWAPRPTGTNHPWLGNNGWQKVTETWNDFLITPHSDPHYNIPFYDYEHWSQAGRYERMVKRLYNPMEKVVRNVGLIKGTQPMMLVIDDIKKDSLVHEYKWMAQIGRDLTLDHYAVNLANTNYQCDIILKEPTGTGNRRLLVRILQNENYTTATPPGIIDTIPYVNYFSGATYNSNPNWIRHRLVVESNSVSPNFKVLLFPYTVGDALPITNWNATKDTLEVVLPNETKTIHFYKDAQNNTQFDLVSPLLNLPIDLVQFTAQRENPMQVALNWLTSKEVNNRGFEVERMFDNQTTFEKIAWVDGKGITNAIQEYMLLDDNTYDGICYYRLKQIDWNGQFSYSSIRTVSGSEKNQGLSLYPTPTTDILYLYSDNLEDRPARIRVYTMDGKLVLDEQKILVAHKSTRLKSAQNLPLGTYLIQINFETGESQNMLFVKQ